MASVPYGDLDLGTMTEGVVELDPMSGRMVLRVPQDNGSNVFLDIQQCLEAYKGQEVRFIVTPMVSIAKLAEAVAEAAPDGTPTH